MSAATKLQSRPLDAENFPEESTLENREFQATEITSFCSPLVWWDAWQYLRDLLTRTKSLLSCGMLLDPLPMRSNVR
jgi:hypothetical protein